MSKVRFLDMEGVTGSIPVAPTIIPVWELWFSEPDPLPF